MEPIVLADICYLSPCGQGLTERENANLKEETGKDAVGKDAASVVEKGDKLEFVSFFFVCKII